MSLRIISEVIMQHKHNKDIVPNAKSLRSNMTREECHLWYDFLRKHPARFSRQKVLGRYFADFYSAQAKLVIELDGSQHYDEAAQLRDSERTAFLEGYDLKVLRFTNLDVNRNFDGVCSEIDHAAAQRIHHNNPSVSCADSSLCTREPENG